MKTPSPYAAILTALAEDKDAKFEVRSGMTIWLERSATELFSLMMDGIAPEKLRIKPATIKIGEREVPKPRITVIREDHTFAFNGLLCSFNSADDHIACLDAICALLEGRE
jgi:hypothetical protein